MNLSVGGMAPKLKMILVLVAAAAALTVALVSVSAPAGAYSGGTSSTSDSGGGKYKRLWNDASRRQKRWANRTAECESGKDPDAIGGGGKYRGAFQFMRRTWRRAPKSPGGDPIKYGYRTQGVVAIYFKKRHGTSAWPNCG